MSTPDERLKSFFVSLGHLGWGAKKWLEIQALPDAFSGHKEFRGGKWFPLSLPTNETLIVVAIAGEVLNYEECFRRFEDLSPVHRLLLDTLQEAAQSGRFVLVFDDRKASIIDRQSEFILTHASTKREWEENLLPLFHYQSISIGAFASYPQKSPRRAGQELAEWTSYWSTEIGSQVSTSKTVMHRFFETLHLACLADQFQEPAKSMFLKYRQKPTKKPVVFLESLFHPLYNHQNFLQMSGVETSLQLARQSSRLTDALESYGRLAKGKLRSDVFAEAFADADFKELSYKAYLRQDRAAELEAESSYENRLQYPVMFKLDELGFVLMLQAFDKRIEQVREEALERKAALARGERPGLQLDLLNAEPQEIAPENAVFAVLKEHFFVETAEPNRLTLARLLLLARACEWNAKLQATDVVYPSVKIQLTAAPRLSSRVLIPMTGELN